jgi:hypothetical protein
MQQHYLTQRMEVAAHRRDLEREAARQSLISQATNRETIYPLDTDETAVMHAVSGANRPSFAAGLGAITRLIWGLWPEKREQKQATVTDTGTYPQASC